MRTDEGERRACLGLGPVWPLRPFAAAAIALVLVLLASAVTWPMACSDGARDQADTLYNAWLLAWNNHALLSGMNPLTPPIFLGQPDGAGRGDLLLAQSLAGAPLLGLGTTPIRAHNMLFVLSIAFAGWAVMLLARRMGADLWGGFFAGCACVCLPYFQSHLWHLQLASVGLGVLALERSMAFLDHRSRGWWIPALILLQGAASLYQWMFTNLAMALILIWALARGLRKRPALLFGLAALGNALMAPLLTHHLSNAASWPVDQIASVDLMAFLSPWESSLLLGGARPGVVFGEVALWPGSAVVVGAAAALMASRLRRRIPAPWLLAGLTVFFGALSLGPTLVAMGRQLSPAPFRLLAMLPGMASIRLPARAGFFALLPLLVIAAIALRGKPGLAIAAAIACLVEVLPRPLSMYEVPRRDEHRWVAENHPASVVFLPLDPSLERPERECERLYGSTLHYTPMVNGYSTSLPEGYRETVEILNRWPESKADSLLDLLGVECVVYQGGELPQANAVLGDGRISASIFLRQQRANNSR